MCFWIGCMSVEARLIRPCVANAPYSERPARRWQLGNLQLLCGPVLQFRLRFGYLSCCIHKSHHEQPGQQRERSMQCLHCPPQEMREEKEEEMVRPERFELPT